MLGPSTEILINQIYQGENFQAIGLEHYATASDADIPKVRSFQQIPPGLNYPICRGASGTRIAYQAFSTTGTADYSIVIDGEGIIRYRGDGVDVTEITSLIDNLIATTIEDHPITPGQFVLEQNFPNPFNPVTIIRFTTHRREQIRLDIFDNQGRFIRTLLANVMNPGTHELSWDGLNGSGQPVASGLYYYQLSGESGSLIKKMMLIR